MVNISSVGGKIAMATYGLYAGTKFALEAVSDALRREVEPLAVKSLWSNRLPSRPKCSGASLSLANASPAECPLSSVVSYAALVHALISQAEVAIPKGVPADEVARVIADAITSKRPRTRYTVGREAALLPLLAILPDRMLDRIHAVASSKPRAEGSLVHRGHAGHPARNGYSILFNTTNPLAGITALISPAFTCKVAPLLPTLLPR